MISRMTPPRLCWVTGLILLCATTAWTTHAQVGEPQDRPKWLKSWEPPRLPEDYRSPAGPHKIVVRSGDTTQPAVLRRIGILQEFRYQGRSLHLISKEVFDELGPGQLEQLNIRDDQNLIRLRDRFFDTTVPQPEVSQQMRLKSQKTPQLHLIQFVGPVQDDWLAALRRVKGIEIVTYMPENAYLVWAGQTVRDELASQAGVQPHVQWQGPFHPAYKLHPAFDLDHDGEVQATIQLYTHKGVDTSIGVIQGKAGKVLKGPRRVGVYTNITVEIPTSELENIARLEDVVNVEPFIEPSVFGERQGQILMGSVNAAGTGPNGPGYLAWVNGLGFTSNFDFTIDVTDDGFDQGETGAADVHPVFLDAGGASRVTYVRRVSGTTISTANDQNRGGHGTINASIASGWNNTPDTAADFAYHGDADGFRYGLGIAPYVLVGSTKILDPWTNPDFTTLIDTAYSGGARISNNSWGNHCRGCCPAGVLGNYNGTSQEYDFLVRDARPTGAAAAPSGGAAGNQEMIIVFAAGNEGACATMGQLGNCGATAKNTLVVGASENFNATGDNDGGGWGNADADDARQVARFSSRGPTNDGRVKPDIMAPGTHIYGAASQDPGYDGDSVSGAPGNIPFNDADEGAGHYPPDPDTTDTRDQDLYTWSSGTSHAAPAVAGGAALLRQWFLDRGHTAPSPALTKAYLMNSATYMTGPADDLPSNNQGMGRMNLGMAFDDTPRLIFDQIKTAHSDSAANADEVFTVQGQVADNTRPFRVTMAYTDAPGTPLAAVIRENDLDLEVNVGGGFYRGNDFTQGASNVGAVADAPDAENNVESVFLPAGTTGDFTVTVRPTNINSDGVPNNGDATDQDFALVIYNAEFEERTPVDIILVLDVSGSMNSTAPGGSTHKIELLRDAVELFVRAWEPFSIPADRMGVVYFSNAVAATFPATTPHLLPFQANAVDIIANVRAQSAGGCTALGGGILTALRGFDDLPDRHKHMIVFTNGMQNRSPMVTHVAGAHKILDDPTAICGDSGIAEEPGAYLADYSVKAIHTIGTGVSGNNWENLIKEIASETGGKSCFTNTPDENLEDFFLEELVESLRADPVQKVATVAGTLTNADTDKTETFEINSTVRKAAFVVSWRGDRRGDALDYSLIAPDGTPVPSSLMRTRVGDYYRVSTLDFHLKPTAPDIPRAGTWQLKFRPNIETDKIDYRVHLIVDDADTRHRFDVPTSGIGVGEAIPLSLCVQQANRTVTNLREVQATISRPPVGFGTVMVENPISQDQLSEQIKLSGDQFANPAQKAAFILWQDDALRKKFEPITETIQLFDDGHVKHGDAKANDGVYSALYPNTRHPGSYDITLAFQFKDAEGGIVSRTDSRSLAVEIEYFDMAKSKLDIRPVRTALGVAYDLDAMLVDAHGNYLGPGHDVAAVVVLPGNKWTGRRVSMDDNLDGSYSSRLALKHYSPGAGARIEVNGSSVAWVAFPER